MSYHRFFNDLNTEFWAQDFASVAARYCAPLPIYSGAAPNVLIRNNDVIQGLSNLHQELVKTGFAKGYVRVVAQSVGTVMTRSVWVEYTSPNVVSGTQSVSNVRYMLTGPAHDPCIALIEYRSSLLGMDRVGDVFVSKIA